MCGRNTKRKRKEEYSHQSLQSLLLSVISGYITMSHDAARVVAVVVPNDVMNERSTRRRDDKETGVEYGESKKQLREEALYAWQRTWNESEQGTGAIRYLPDVGTLKTLSGKLTTMLHNLSLGKLREFNKVEKAK